MPRAVLVFPIRIAGYDIDYAGIVNNGVYIRWLEDMRTAYMARWLTLEGAAERGLVPVLARTEIDYRSPLRLGHGVVGRMWAAEVGRATARIATHIIRADDGRICAASLQTVCFVDAASGRPTRLPAEFRATLTRAD